MPKGYTTSTEYRRRWAKTNPEKVRAYSSRYRSKNRAKVALWNKRARTAAAIRNPDGRRVKDLRTRYGLTTTQWSGALAAQGGGCAICSGPGPFHTDHDHTTRVFRGVLCSRCNHGLGLFKDDPLRLRRAADYVEKA